MADAPATTGTTVVKGLLEPPPRSTGDIQKDIPLLLNWLYKFYLTNQSQAQYLNNQTSTGDFDPSTLPDPATSTIAQAQDTANKAYTLAKQVESTADAANNRTKGWYRFNITFGATDDQITYDFGANGKDDQTDTDYMVILSPKAFTGSPVIDAFIIIKKAYTTSGFTVTINAAPGAVSSVTYDGILIRIG